MDGTPDADAEPTDATGTIVFNDVDLSDNPEASVSTAAQVDATDATDLGVVITATLANGLVLTAEQNAALRDAFNVDATTFDALTGEGAIDWTYSVTNAEIDFLGETDSVELVYTVVLNDGNGGVTNQLVTVTVNGANDAPLIEIVMADGDVATAELTEQSESGDAAFGAGLLQLDAGSQSSGTLTVTDVDVSDVVTIEGVVVTVTNGRDNGLTSLELDALFVATPPTLIDGTTNTGELIWTFDTSAATEDLFDYLDEGEFVELTYTITVEDENGASALHDVVVTINGADDEAEITEISATAIDGTTVTALTDLSIDESGVDNDVASFVVAVQESVDSAPNDDADPVQIVGLIDFITDLQEAADPTEVEIEVVNPVVAPGSLLAGLANSGNQFVLSDAQIATLINAFSATLGDIDPLTGQGEIDWSYSLDNADIDFLSAGDSFSFTYDVIIHDNGDGASNAGDDTTATITVNVVGTNDNPVITSTGTVTNLSTTEGSVEASSSTTLTSVLQFSDVDLGDGFNVTVSSTSSNGLFYGTLQPLQPSESPLDSGVFGFGVNYQITSNDSFGLANINSLAEGEVVVETYTVSITDIPGGGSVTRDIVVTLTGENDAPTIEVVVGNNDESTGALDLTDSDNDNLTGRLTVTDVDVTDVVSVTSVEAVVQSGTLGGSFTQASDLDGLLTAIGATTAEIIGGAVTSGTVNWEFIGDAEDFAYLAEGEMLVIDYTITVADDNSLSDSTDTQVVTVTITGVDDATTITSTGDFDGALNESATTDTGVISLEDVDVTNAVQVTPGDATLAGDLPIGFDVTTLNGLLTVSPVEAIGNSATTGNFTWTFNNSGNLFDELAAGETASVTYTLAIDDQSGASITQDVTIVVTGENDAPELTVGAVADIAEGGTADITGFILAGSDVDDAAADLTYTVSNQLNGAVQVSGVAATTFTQADVDNSAVTFIHDGGETTSISFDVSLADGGESSAAAATGTVTVGISPAVNDAPLVSSASVTVAEESTGTSLGLIAPTDDDGDTLTITVTGLPSVGTVMLNGTAVVMNDVLSASDLEGLVYDAPLAFASNLSVTNFTYGVSDGIVTETGTVTFMIEPGVVDVTAPTSITVDENGASVPLGITVDAVLIDPVDLMITLDSVPGLGEGTVVIPGTPPTLLTGGETLTIDELESLEFFPEPVTTSNVDSQISIQFVDSNSSSDSETTTIDLTIVNNVAPPVLIDLDGDGIEITESLFDFDNDGIQESGGFTSADDAILAIDINLDGNVNGVGEIALADLTDEEDTDLEALATLVDENNDGLVDANDSGFDSLLIWQDINQNGVADDGEVMTLEEAGIASISTEYLDDSEAYTVDGLANVLGESEVTFTDGSTTVAADAQLLYSDAPIDFSNMEANNSSEIDDLDIALSSQGGNNSGTAATDLAASDLPTDVDATELPADSSATDGANDWLI